MRALTARHGPLAVGVGLLAVLCVVFALVYSQGSGAASHPTGGSGRPTPSATSSAHQHKAKKHRQPKPGSTAGKATPGAGQHSARKARHAAKAARRRAARRQGRSGQESDLARVDTASSVLRSARLVAGRSR